MRLTLNADEVLEMAIRIETNGRAFYLKAAQLQSDAQIAGFFKKLAAMEQEHIETFEQFRRELSSKEKEGQAYDPDGLASMYLATMADTHDGEGDPRTARDLTGHESVEEILSIALNLEKQSILFYVGLKDFVAGKSGKDKVDAVIDQEKLHITQLSEVLRDVSTS